MNTTNLKLLAVSTALAFTFTTKAATLTWTGLGSTANWSDTNNWDTLSAPINGDSLVFDEAASSFLASTNNIASLVLGGFAFTNTAVNFEIWGNPITMQANAGVTADGSGNRTINVPLSYPSAVTAITPWQIFSGEVTLTSNLIVTASGQSGVGYLSKNGSGILRLKGPDNRFTETNGAPRISSGRFILDGGSLTVTNDSMRMQAFNNSNPRLVLTNNASLTMGVAGQGTARLLIIGTGGVATGATNHFDIASGTLTILHPGSLRVGNHVDQPGIVNQNGGTVDLQRNNNPGLELTFAAAVGGATYNLNGGTLLVRNISASNPGAVFNFNGGTLKAFTSVAPNVFPAGPSPNLTVNVQDGDAVVDTAGFNWNLNSMLNGVGTGGLVKKGAGELTLATTNTFKGPVQVQQGMLIYTGPRGLGGSTNTVTVSSGAILRGNGAQEDSFYNLIFESGSTYQNRGAGIKPSGPIFQLNGPVTFDINAYLKINSSITAGATNGAIIMTTTNITGTNTIQFDSASTYSLPGQTTVGNACKLRFNGTVQAGGVTVQSGGLLEVLNIFNAPTIIQSGGSFGPGFTDATATYSVTNNATLTFQAGAICNFQLNSTNLTTDQVLGLNSVTYGGSLVVTDFASPGGFAVGQVYRLFQATNYIGGFGSISLPALTGDLAWNTNSLNSDGTIRVVSTLVPTPEPLVFSVSGNSLNVSWTNAAFRLQAQTNSTSVGLNTNWFDYPGGSTSPVSVPINPANGSVFLRLKYP